MMRFRSPKLSRLFRMGLVLVTILSLALPTSVTSAAKTAAAFPDPPALVSPAPYAVVYATQDTPRALPIFQWSEVTDALTYELQVDVEPTFNTNGGKPLLTIITPHLQATSSDMANLPDRVLYWHVKVSKDKYNQASVFGETRSFTKNWLELANGVPNDPKLKLPVNGAVFAFTDPTGDPNAAPAFSWAPVLGATSYTLEFSLNFQFNPVYTYFDTVNTTFQPAAKLADNTYYWRVKPKQTGSPSDWTGTASEIRQVTFNYTANLPVEIEPANGATPTFTPTFRWTPVRGAERYVLQYSTDDTFLTKNEVTTYTTSFSPTSPFENNKAYYWRVRAVSGNSSSDSTWSSSDNPGGIPYTFQMRWYVTPILLTPTNGYGYVDNPYFSWTPIPGAARYRIEMNDTNTFPNPPKYFYETNSNTYYIKKSPPNCPPFSAVGTTVYWRVIPVDKEGKYGDASGSFYFNCNNSGNAPQLVYPLYYYPPQLDPASNRYVNPYDDRTVGLPTLSWRRVVYSLRGNQAAARYSVQVASDQSFNNVVWSGSTRSLSITVPQGVLQPNTNYFWRVMPTLNDGTPDGQWSQRWYFRYNPELLPQRSGVALLRPTHGSEWIETVPVLEWYPVTGATSYDLEISQSPDPATFESDGLVYSTNVVYPAFSYTELLPFGTYYWRVRARNGANPMTDWSNPFRFQEAAQSRWRQTRILGTNNTLQLASDPAGDMTDSNYDLTDLYIMQDSIGWYFGFHVNTSPTDMRYVLYLDTNHVDGSGGTTDPEGYAVTTTPAHRPDALIYVDQTAGSFQLSNVRVYTWNGYDWNFYLTLDQVTNANLLYSDGYLEMLIPGPTLGINDVNSTMSVSLFSVLNAGGHPQDSVPSDPAVSYATPGNTGQTDNLTRFASVSERAQLIYPYNVPLYDESTFSSLPPLLWNPLIETPSPCEYNVRLARDPQFAALAYTAQQLPQPGITLDNDLTGDDRYYWQGRAKFLIGQQCIYGGAWSEGSSFVRSGKQVQNLQSSINLIMPQLSWDRAEGAEVYEVQIANSSTFASPVVSTTTALNSFIPTNTPFLNDTVYYWRVRSRQVGNVNDPWSEVQTFSFVRPIPTGLFAVPSTAQTSASLYPPTLCWSPTTSAWKYRVEIYYEENMSTAYYAENTEQVCHTVPLGIRDGLFYWRVRMMDGKTVFGDASPLSSYSKYYPRPSLIAPMGEVPAKQTPLFKWTPVMGAAKYKIEVMNPLNNQVLHTATVLTTEYQPLTVFSVTTMSKYRWHVAIIDKNGNQGPWSDFAYVTVDQNIVFIPFVRR